MEIKESIEIRSTPAQVFRLYKDAAGWADWDPEVSNASLPGGLELGAKGWLKPKVGPKGNIQIVEMTEGKSFSVQSRLPLCRMEFGHLLTEVEGGTVATHWVEFCGPLSFLFRYLVGRSIQASMPNTMQGLKKSCEAQARSREC
ncbi:SRPBCC family protein [Pseudomonas sp. MS-1(2024)]|uniref:SRPBCC family protein n=1 Tax=Pseudomonas sp. MS-1(2024) TaxID=3112251 RepID=UPI002DBB34EF|nr:SRPBCC family protein [Pseudomonas sp. MS-1(2024)]MEC4168558.1 SRPBCC family protein [Pseudomonas sp. MS-1(2024)]